MELKGVIEILKKQRKTVSLTALLFGLVGVAAYFISPQKYVASGSFFVARKVDLPSAEFFTYEGYYGQQSALSFTKTMIGLFESVDVRSQALKSLNISVSASTLRNFNRRIKVDQSAPQLIKLEVKAASQSEAVNMWKALSSSSLLSAEELNRRGDSSINVVSVSENPVVRETFHNIFANVIVGAGLGFVVGSIVVAMKEYLS